jgi:hypothetical protein
VGLKNIKTVEQNYGAFADLAQLPETDGVRQLGKGKIIEIDPDVDDLDGKYPGALDAPRRRAGIHFQGRNLVLQQNRQSCGEKDLRERRIHADDFPAK